jgi:protein tyrosine/serine phosphatase
MHSFVDLARRARIGAVCLAAVCVAGTAIAVHEVRRAASHADEKLSLPGVSNFGRMSARLYRGAQPTPEGFAALSRIGIRTVVRLSLGEEGSATEEAQVRALGMAYVNLPWSTRHEPEPEQVVTFLNLLHDVESGAVFVHCKAGADRTGVMVALSRIALDRWPADRAIDEMRAFRYYYVFLPHLQHYVEAFPATLASSPNLKSIAGGGL